MQKLLKRKPFPYCRTGQPLFLILRVKYDMPSNPCLSFDTPSLLFITQLQPNNKNSVRTNKSPRKRPGNVRKLLSHQRRLRHHNRPEVTRTTIPGVLTVLIMDQDEVGRVRLCWVVENGRVGISRTVKGRDIHIRVR